MPRELLEIDEKVVEAMALLGGTNVEIADFVGCDESVIRKRFPEILTKSRARMRRNLRRWQWKAAKGGNIAMMIWLGKQYLGQTDKMEETGEKTYIVKEKGIDASPRVTDSN